MQKQDAKKVQNVRIVQIDGLFPKPSERWEHGLQFTSPRRSGVRSAQQIMEVIS